MFRRRRSIVARSGAFGSGDLPETMADVTGYAFRPSHLTETRVVIVIVFKSTECPVCPVLLQRLSFLSGNPVWEPTLQTETEVARFKDPITGVVTQLPSQEFRTAARLVLFSDATFIVICPGSAQKLATIAQAAGTVWKNTPFVPDSRELSITMRLVNDEFMRLDRGEAIPAILEYDGSNHIVDFGRGPGRYGDVQLLQLLFRHRSQIEGDTQHTIAHANLLLSKTAAVHLRLSNSPHQQVMSLPSEILEQIISYIPPQEIHMQWAKVSIAWYLAALSAVRNHLRETIQKTESLLCVVDGETVCLDCDSGQYPPGTEVRYVPIKQIESMRKDVMNWYNVLCRVVGFKL